MTSMTTTLSPASAAPAPSTPDAEISAGVDTHSHTHHAAVLNSLGRPLGDREFPTTPAGYQALLTWLNSHGPLGRVGVEGTGSYGAGLARVLRAAGVQVVEVAAPTAEPDAPKASPTRWMPTPPPAPP